MAVVVVIAAVAIYLGVRAELRGEVDNSLRDRAGALTTRGGDRGAAACPASRTDGGGPADRDGALPAPPPEPFGGPEGFAQLVLPSGQRRSGRPAVARRAPAWTRRRARDRAQRLGRVPRPTTTVSRHPPARPHPRRRRSAARSRWRARSTRWTASWTACCSCCCSWAPRAWRSAPALGAPWSRGPRSRPIDRFTRRTEELARRPRPLAADRGDQRRRRARRGSRAASTPRSTRSSAPSRRSASSWPTRATSCARRSPACARTSRRSSTRSGCRPAELRSRCAPTSSPSWTS